MSKKRAKSSKPPKRQTRYDPTRHPTLIFALCVVGKTDSEICEILKLGDSTLNKWREAYPEVNKAFNDAREEGAVLEVQNAMYKRALGMKVTTQQVRSKVDDDGKLVPVGASKQEQELPPDVKAGQYILNNRKPKDWKSRVELGVEAKVTGQPYDNVHYYLPENGRPLIEDKPKAIEAECKETG